MRSKKGKRKQLLIIIQLIVLTLIISSIPIQSKAESVPSQLSTEEGAPEFVPASGTKPVGIQPDNLPAPVPKPKDTVQKGTAAKPIELVQKRTENEKAG